MQRRSFRDLTGLDERGDNDADGGLALSGRVIAEAGRGDSDAKEEVAIAGRLVMAEAGRGVSRMKAPDVSIGPR